MAKNNPLVKPFVKWAGGKRQLLSEIQKHVPKRFGSYTYYEPFVGGGAVFFELQPKKAVINDVNAQLVMAYAAVRDSVEELLAALRAYKSKNDEAQYYAVRDLDRDAETFGRMTDVEKAARLLFLNKTCYNGLYRVNAQGLFNVPFGRYKNPSICAENALRATGAYLSANKITILQGDFEQAAARAGKNSFVYFDPPYYSPGKTNFTGYCAEGFGERDHERLRNLMLRLTERGAKCLLSNSDTDFIRALYDRECFDLVSVKAKRVINSDAAGRGTVDEVLIRNWKE